MKKHFSPSPLVENRRRAVRTSLRRIIIVRGRSDRPIFPLIGTIR